MKFRYNDGGRKRAGICGAGGDCVPRSIAIVTDIPYLEVCKGLNEVTKKHERKKKAGISRARTGVFRNTYDRYLKALRWKWVPTMFIGSGCKVHLKKEELPSGKLIVCLSQHMTAVIDGVIYDTHNPSRDETRCVYGWFHKESK